MANKKGHWYTDKNGNHYFVEEGQTPQEGWEASKRRKMIDGGKYKVSEDGSEYTDVTEDEYNKYEADETDFDETNEDDFGFDEEDSIVTTGLVREELLKLKGKNSSISKDELEHLTYMVEDALEREQLETGEKYTDISQLDLSGLIDSSTDEIHELGQKLFGFDSEDDKYMSGQMFYTGDHAYKITDVNDEEVEFIDEKGHKQVASLEDFKNTVESDEYDTHGIQMDEAKKLGLDLDNWNEVSDSQEKEKPDATTYNGAEVIGGDNNNEDVLKDKTPLSEEQSKNVNNVKYLAPEEIGIDYDNPEASIKYYEKKNNVKLYEQPNGSFKVVPNKESELSEADRKWNDYKEKGKSTWNQKLHRGDKVTIKNKEGNEVEAFINGFYYKGELQNDDTYEEGKDNPWHDFRGVNLVDDRGRDIGNINANQIISHQKSEQPFTKGRVEDQIDEILKKDGWSEKAIENLNKKEYDFLRNVLENMGRLKIEKSEGPHSTRDSEYERKYGK